MFTVELTSVYILIPILFAIPNNFKWW